jgi:hypothetical protein
MFLISSHESDVNFEVKGQTKQHDTGRAVASGAQKDG